MAIYSINALPNSLYLGKQTETGVREIRIDCAPWFALWPNLSISVWVTPPGSAAAYPAAVQLEGEVLTWPITCADTATAGGGYVEIMGAAEGQKKLSATVPTLIQATTTGATTEPPAPAQPWVDQVLDAADRAEAAAVHPPIIGDNGHWYLWNLERGEYVDSNVPSGGGTVEVDATLTQEGKAADAKAAGDRISQLFKEIERFTDDVTVVSDVVTTLFDSDTDEWVHKSTDVNGNIIDTTNLYAPPIIDAAGYDHITVRVNAFNSNGVGTAPYALWIMQYDENMQPIAGERKGFALHPINEDGKVYEGYESNRLEHIQDKAYVGGSSVLVGFAYGGQNTVKLAEGARYFLLFNLKEGTTTDMEIFGTNSTTQHERVLAEDNLIVSKKVDNIQSALFGDGRMLFDSNVDAFVSGQISLQGAPTNPNDETRFRLPLIDLSEGNITVRVDSYFSNGVGSESPQHNIWIAQYDENYSMLKNGRTDFKLHPVEDENETSDLLTIGRNIGNGWEGAITPMDGAKYAVIFNFFTGATLDISVVARKGDQTGIVEETADVADKVERLSKNLGETTVPFIGSANIPLIATVFGSSSTYPTDFTAVAVADMHGAFISLDDANLIRSTYAASAPILNAGDMIRLRSKADGVIIDEVGKYMEKAIRYGVYHTMGQHETGWSNTNVDIPSDKGYFKANCMTHDEVFQTFIAPMKDVWGLPDLTTNYYYKDFGGMRLISLYQYNIPLYDDPNDSAKYKYLRSSVWFGQEQLNWLIDTLNTVPSGSKVLILMHQSESAIVDSGDNNAFFGGRVPSGNNIIDGTPVADIVQAFIDKTSISKTYTCIDTAKYTESDFTITVSGDFTNAQGEFANYITGDSHVDSVGYIENTQQRALGLTSSSSPYDCVVEPASTGEIRRLITLLGYCYSGKYIKMGRIGQQYTLKCQHRILEKINFK